VRAGVVILVAACGRIGFDATPPADSTAPDAGPFGAPTLVAELGGAGFDDDPTLTANLLEIYFASDRPGGAGGGSDIWVARRDIPTGTWSVPLPATDLNSTAEDESPGISPDGLTIYFASRRLTNPAGSNIFVATRQAADMPWSMPVLASDLSSGADDFQAQPLSVQRLVMYRNTGGQRDLFEAARQNAMVTWSIGGISVVNTANEERSPCLAIEGRELYFGSNRDSGIANVQDLYLATRETTDAIFAPARPLAELNSPQDDDDPWVSPDGRVIYFSSTRSGNSEIYEARR
jgi:Tol biopolymer transport system component